LDAEAGLPVYCRIVDSRQDDQYRSGYTLYWIQLYRVGSSVRSCRSAKVGVCVLLSLSLTSMVGGN
jgi:hypothetical protein